MDLRTARATIVVGALALLLIAGAAWAFVVGPETAKLSAVRTQVQDARDQNATLRVQLTALEAQSRDLGAVRRAAAALAAKFPPTADQPGLFQSVTAAAVDAGIGADGVTTLAPTPPAIGGDPATAGVAAAPPAGGGQLARQSVSISVEGSYEQTRQLLANLERMPRAYLVTSVSLSGGGAEGYTTTVVGDMFLMPPVTDPDDVPADGAAGAAGAAGVATTPPPA